MRQVVLLAISAAAVAAQVHQVPASQGWFPSDPAQLGRLLDQTLAVAEKRGGTTPPRQKLMGLIVPHAGLAYSGGVAASAYRRLHQPGNVIVLGFSHRRALSGITAPDLDAYQTPVGEVKVNRAVLKELKFPTVPEEQLCDHSLENQLPFLARVAPQATVVPLYVGSLSEPELAAAARRLAVRVKQGDVLVASSDMTHYGEAYGYAPFPKDELLPKRLLARTIDLVDMIGTLDPGEFERYLTSTKDTTCGWGPIRVLMAALAQTKEEVYLSALDYLASGQLTGDYSQSVGYVAAAFYPESAYGVTPADQRKLLASARRTLEGFFSGGQKALVAVPPEQRNADLEQSAGVFVTLKKNGRLRGCVGHIFPARPLWDAVADRTLAAASEDPRFKPLEAKDGPVTLEVSILTPLRRLANWRQFRVGQGGMILLDGKSGLILPQIAREMGWNRDQFLENLSQKAGLPRDAYRDPRAQLYVYTAQVFGEPGGETPALLTQ